MSDNRVDMLGLGVALATSGWWLGFDWRIGVAVACYAMSLAVARALMTD
mgnify:CR=1 FL=1